MTRTRTIIVIAGLLCSLGHAQETTEQSATDLAKQTQNPVADLIETADRIARETAEAHKKFLQLSEEATRSYAEAFNLHTKLLQRAMQESESSGTSDTSTISKSELPHSEIPHSDPVTMTKAVNDGLEALVRERL